MRAHRRKAVLETVCLSLSLSNPRKFILSLKARVIQERIKFSIFHRQDAMHEKGGLFS